MTGRKLEKNNPIIVVNIFCIKEKEIFLAYISKHKSTCEKIYSLNDSKQSKRWMALSCSKI